jgi:hypothetical protein
VDYYNGSDRLITNIEISTLISSPPPLVTVTLSLVTLPNTKTHETEVRQWDFKVELNDLFRLFVLPDWFINNFQLIVQHQNVLIKIILLVSLVFLLRNISIFD